MAKVTIQIPDEVLGLAENPQQVESEVLQAVLAFWIARGMVAKKAIVGELLSKLIEVHRALREKPQTIQQTTAQLSHGGISPAGADVPAVITSLQPGLERLRGKRTLQATSKGLAELLLAIPSHPEDFEFERIRELGREPPRWFAGL